MARATLRVEGATLVDHADATQTNSVGTPAWYAWLGGAPMAALLCAARVRRILPDYAATLLTIFPSERATSDLQPDDAGQAARLAEPLSLHEREVLRLVVAGHSNAEIARTLVISVGTVKAHINTIFGMLQVTSRTQAIGRARELELV